MNLPARTHLKNFFSKYFPNQQPEAALRYAPAITHIKSLKKNSLKILEVGLGPFEITPYLKREIDLINSDFTQGQKGLAKKIQGSFLKIPVNRESYDATVSADFLSQIKSSEREIAIYEMLRVTKKLLVIITPCSQESKDQDIYFKKFWNKVSPVKNVILERNAENSACQTEEILVLIDKYKRLLKKSAKVKSYPSLNLFIRNILMRTWITKNRYLYYLYLKGYLLLVPILKYCNFGKTYRRVFVIEFS